MKLVYVFCAFIALTPVYATMGCGIFDRGVEKYDALVLKNTICDQKWADYEANLQRRANMIPNLVEVAKAAAGQENKTLKEVMEARASATQIKISGEDLNDPEKMKKFEEAQQNLKGSLSRLMIVQEQYPDLKSNKQFENLMIQIEGTENRILRAITEYNKVVAEYNFELGRVSGKVINPMTGNEFKPRVFFAANANAKDAPIVNFNNTPTTPTK